MFFSFSKTKEDLYIFPVVAAVAALVADLLTSEDGLRRRATGAIFVCTVRDLRRARRGRRSGGSATATTASTPRSRWPWCSAPVDSAPSCCGCEAGAATAIATLAAGFIAFNYQFVGRVLPDVERLKPVPPLARTFTSRAAPDARLAQLNMSLPSLTFYLNRPVPELLSSIDAVDLLGGAPEAWLVTNEETWNVVRAQVPAACLADRRPLFAFDSAKLSDLCTARRRRTRCWPRTSADDSAFRVACSFGSPSGSTSRKNGAPGRCPGVPGWVPVTQPRSPPCAPFFRLALGSLAVGRIRSTTRNSKCSSGTRRHAMRGSHGPTTIRSSISTSHTTAGSAGTRASIAITARLSPGHVRSATTTPAAPIMYAAENV